MTWQMICPLNDIPQMGARVVKHALGSIAVFRTASDEVFALDDACPHKGGPLSQGIVFGQTVVCPLHSWKLELDTGEAHAPDVGCSHKHTTKIEDGMVWLEVPADLPTAC